MLFGFKRIHVGVYDEAETKVIEKMTWEDKAGGAVRFNLTGLAPEQLKVYASNGPVWVQRKGTGDVKADLEVFNIPEADLNKVLGLDVEGQEAWMGAYTQAPYIAVICETEDINGNPILVGLPKGTATLDNLQMETLEEKPKPPENDKLSISFVNAEIDGKDRICGKYVATSKEDAGIAAFVNKILVGYTGEALPIG